MDDLYTSFRGDEVAQSRTSWVLTTVIRRHLFAIVDSPQASDGLRQLWRNLVIVIAEVNVTGRNRCQSMTDFSWESECSPLQTFARNFTCSQRTMELRRAVACFHIAFFISIREQHIYKWVTRCLLHAATSRESIAECSFFSRQMYQFVMSL